ncbi:pyridoxamine 5'-phosphate oxidase family protein [Herbidospora galbida]|uniref:Pyridoxamine 5'-phosphate oxidase family protein n=1 Tax=Herbidospora galbida TaxID=2575442 RepID=A0A4U3MAH8_9ACTN|nr:pyridoxamine 5'-phosphate oxidase family protein [Herbidospora galbida]TKK86138.1 pyridoxamine 5'-phosphate oxidase family protein [Herbidospora galbida]
MSTLRTLTADECLALIAPGGVGRIAFSGSHGPTILPVNYRLDDGVIVFRTRTGGAMDDDLRTHVDDLEIVVAFEVDAIDPEHREGWSVLVQGPCHHAPGAPGDSWVEDRDHLITIRPQRITGRRLEA